MVTETSPKSDDASRIKEKLERAADVALSNPNVDLSDLEAALKVVEALTVLGVRPQDYDLLAPTDSRHSHANSDEDRDKLDLT